MTLSSWEERGGCARYRQVERLKQGVKGHLVF